MSNSIRFAYFGSSSFSVTVLDELKNLGYVPHCIVTSPDKPQGRKMLLTANIVKTWAIENGIKFYEPIKLTTEFADELEKEKCEVFVVASYGKIIPERIVNMPIRGSLNIHPSLLPLYRGPSPLPTAILDDTKDTGITIMLMDKEMDHGPIVAQKEIHIEEWPPYEQFENIMAKQGAELLAHTLPKWLSGDIKAIEQDHSNATYTKKIEKDDGLIDLGSDAYTIFRKIQAFSLWPKAFFIIEKNGKPIRVKITSAKFANDKLEIQKVIPEGGKEMNYSDFKRGYMLE